MSREKQIDIIESDIKTGMRSMEIVNPKVYRGLNYRSAAEHLEAIGYRKQSEGEWATKDLNNPLYESKKAPRCSNCEYISFIRYDYCPNCGAKMKGGAE